MEKVLIFPTLDGISEDWCNYQFHFLEGVHFIRYWIVDGQICIVDGSVEKIICSIECGNIDIERAAGVPINRNCERLNSRCRAPTTVDCNVDVDSLNKVPCVEKTEWQIQGRTWSSREWVVCD